MSLYFDTDVCILNQSRERWSASQSLSDICPGEKTELQANYSRIASQQGINMIGKPTTTLAMGSTGHQEGWTECFQDLQTWCPPPQDELNTPQVTTDDFNFGTIDQYQVRYLDDMYPVDLIPDSLGDEMAYPHIDNLGIKEENNNTPPYLKLPQSSNTCGKLYTSCPTNTKSPLKSTSSNILLSQTFLQQPSVKIEDKTRPTDMDSPPFQDMIAFDLTEDEENYMSMPPIQIAKKVKDFRVPSQENVMLKKQRPKLKLDIAPPATTPTVDIPSTPEVQIVLNEPNAGFDLIKYVVSGADFTTGDAAEEVSPIPKIYNESFERDHDYVDPGQKPYPNDTLVIKSEPLSPGACAAAISAIECKIKTTERGRPIKRSIDSNSDYVFDSDLGSSDDSAEWEPSTSKGYKKTSRTKRIKTLKGSRAVTSYPVKAESDDESVSSSLTTDKYRELRDKNNEASRRSRLNRKQRDMEMKSTADELESNNRALRARADRMQKLVLDMRNIIMQTVKGAKKM